VHFIECGLKTSIILAFFTSNGGSIQLANELNDVIALFPKIDITPLIGKSLAGQAPNSCLHQQDTDQRQGQLLLNIQ